MLQSGLTLNGSGASLGTLDITNNAIVVTYTTSSPQTTIRNEIISGFDGGAWDGHGITSSSAAADANVNGLLAVGYIDNSALGNPDIPTNSVLFRLTRYGDADLNGTVDLNDFSAWQAGYLDPTDNPAAWDTGDFDYSGTVDLNDFSAWQTSYLSGGGSLGALDQAITNSSLNNMTQQQLFSILDQVPEPTSITLIGMVSLGLLSRRRLAKNEPVENID
jgi:PEP-CTERM motif